MKYLKIKFLAWLFFGATFSRSEFEAKVRKQRAKGLKKYGRGLKDCAYDSRVWRLEILEELIDADNYSFKMKSLK